MPDSYLHPAGKPYRFLVLIIASILPFGSYFAYDVIGAVAPSLVEELGASREAVGGNYTAYSVAAILALIIGGVMIDRLGTRFSSIIFSVIVTGGALLVAVSGSMGVMLSGRFVFGAGSEPLIVAQSAILARWFKGKELALAFGIALTVSRLGTFLTFNLGETIAEYYGSFRYALYASVILCVFSLLANIVYIILDRRGEQYLELEEVGTEDKIVFSDIRTFPASYWMVCLLCVTFYSAIFPFTALSTDFFVDKWGIAATVTTTGGIMQQMMYKMRHAFDTAGGLTSIPILASMFLAPFAGHFVDRYGKRASLMIFGSVILIPAHLSMGLTNIYPALPMAVLGVAFVMVPAAMWPAVPLVVKKKHVGTAFGLMTVIQNFGLAAFPWLNGLLRDRTQDYRASMIMFASLGIAGLVFAFLLKWADKREGGVLESGKQPA